MDTDRDKALLCWELARYDGPVTIAVFGRMACRPKPGEEVTYVAAKQATMRFAADCRELGLEMRVVDKVLVFRREDVLEIVRRLRPGLLSPRTGTRGAKGARPSMSEHQADQLLTLKESAQLLNLGASTLRKWLVHSKAALPCVRLGSRTVRIKRGDLLAYVEAHRHKSNC